jgi:hypothetical protein
MCPLVSQRTIRGRSGPESFALRRSAWSSSLPSFFPPAPKRLDGARARNARRQGRCRRANTAGDRCCRKPDRPGAGPIAPPTFHGGFAPGCDEAVPVRMPVDRHRRPGRCNRIPKQAIRRRGDNRSRASPARETGHRARHRRMLPQRGGSSERSQSRPRVAWVLAEPQAGPWIRAPVAASAGCWNTQPETLKASKTIHWIA